MKKFVTRRRLTEDVMCRLAVELERVRWHEMYHMNDCNQQAAFFYNSINNVVDSVAPLEVMKIKSSDRPWVTVYFKNLIAKRGAAFASGNFALFKSLRNRVNRVRKSLRKQYYLDKIESLKFDHPSKWWKNMKSLCHLENKCTESCFEHATYQSQVVDFSRLPEVINKFFVEVTNSIPALDVSALNKLRQNLDPVPDEYVVSVIDVCDRLSRIKLNKAVGADGIPNKILRQMAHILGPPLAAIINCSLRQGTVPDVWKLSRITPLPKTLPVCSIESDVRPIAITNSVAKVAESFVCNYFSYSFNESTDSNQLGCVRGRSTTQALLQIMHELFQASELSNNIIRILFIDFSKAFDLIDHNILLQKFVANGLPDHITAWSLDFVSGRKQFVKIGDNCSTLLCTNAGTPQGTLAGPNNFKLLINDLAFNLPYIKYVDNTTVLSVSVDPDDSSVPAAADHLVD